MNYPPLTNKLSNLDIRSLIKNVKIGRERKDAQIDTCCVFAAALYDILLENDLKPKLVCASMPKKWHHMVVEIEGEMFDSLGEFNTFIMRKRLKIHPKVKFELTYTAESRSGCFEEEYRELYKFFLEKFRKEIEKQKREKNERKEESPI